MMDRENASYIFSMESGAVRIKPIVSQRANLVVLNSAFDNLNAKYGSAFSLFEVGKVLVKLTNFTRN
jgi:hypothetical protein